jgi:ribosomal protein S18 acetylase RimI-like enzyme
MSEPLDAADVTTSTLNVRYRECRPTDIPVCAEIEAASYPSDEAASKSSLQYRQHHAARYFLCAVLREVVGPDESDDCTTSDDHHDTVIGFVCSTKCHSFTHESMSVHEPTGSLLAIHSVVVAEPYRKQGIATRMLQAYIQRIATAVEPKERPAKIVLLSKAHLLAFYVKCGFQVM